MSVSTNGQICYGILFEEGFEFPWSNDEYEGDFHVWWDKTGNGLPCLVDVVNYCSCDYPMYILAARGSVESARRGFPATFDPAEMADVDEYRQILLGFCEQYGIKHDFIAAWYLSSLWC